MGEIGDVLAGHDDVFVDAFEDPVTIRNWYEGDTPDEEGDYPRVAHPSNPIETTGQVEQPQDPAIERSDSGMGADVDAEILLPDDALVTAGGGTDSAGRYLAWASEIETHDGKIYTVVTTFDEGNGRIRCQARDSGEVDDRHQS